MVRAQPREDMEIPPTTDVWWISSNGRKILARTWFEARNKIGGFGTVHNVQRMEEK
jgi:hypothetical protein